jgi:glycosyltransferase involved in cell wall biosynthesis
VRILLLNQAFYPDVVSTAQHLGELAAELARRGHQVTVVTGRRAYDEPDKKFPARETWRGVEIYRVASTRFGKEAKWRRAADFASFIFFCCARLVFLRHHDVVVALTTPPLISFIGAWRAKLWGARFCYWVMDLNPDEAVAAGWLRADSFAGRMLERMSRYSLRRADRIIALDRFMRDHIAAKGINADKIVVIPPWSHDNEVRFDSTGREQFRKEHGLQDKFVVMYAGNHSPVHPLDTLMAAAERLGNDAGIAFCFMGGGSGFRRVKSWADACKRSNVICLPYQPLGRLSGSLSAADAHMVVLGEHMLGLVHPCKIYNVLAVGAPVIYIGPTPSHVTEILDAAGDTYLKASVHHGDAELLVREILELRQGTKASRKALTAEMTAGFSKDMMLPKMIAAIESTMPGSPVAVAAPDNSVTPRTD